MKCRIKRNSLYFNKHIGLPAMPNHWSYRDEAKVFDDGRKARGVIKKYNLKNVEIEYVSKG